MARDTVDFIRSLGFEQVDLLGFSLGGFISQVIAQEEPQLVRKMILAGTGPAGGTGIDKVTAVTIRDMGRHPSSIPEGPHRVRMPNLTDRSPKALRLKPGLARAEVSAKLCDELLAAPRSPDGELTRESLGKLLSSLPIQRDIDGIALVLQELLEQRRELPLVLDKEEVHRVVAPV